MTSIQAIYQNNLTTTFSEGKVYIVDFVHYEKF